MKVRGIATDRDVLQIQRKLEVDGHRAKIVSRAELALRWTYIRDTEEKDKKIREARNNNAKTQREKEEKLRRRAQQAQKKKDRNRRRRSTEEKAKKNNKKDNRKRRKEENLRKSKRGKKQGRHSRMPTDIREENGDTEDRVRPLLAHPPPVGPVCLQEGLTFQGQYHQKNKQKRTTGGRVRGAVLCGCVSFFSSICRRFPVSS